MTKLVSINKKKYKHLIYKYKLYIDNSKYNKYLVNKS